MKIIFLGTGAAEAIPSPFCDCEVCNRARLEKGVNIRRRSSILINDDLLIDIGPDLAVSCAYTGICLNNLAYLLITHPHFDHLYLNNLEIRGKRYIKNNVSKLLIVGAQSVIDIIEEFGTSDLNIETKKIDINAEVQLEKYTIRSIKANHAPEYGDALNYIIKFNDKKVLYASDTGVYDDAVLDSLNGMNLDVLIIESTNTFTKTSKNHLNNEKLQKVLSKMKYIKAINENTKIYTTHFSHSANKEHKANSSFFAKEGIICAYDGLVVEV